MVSGQRSTLISRLSSFSSWAYLLGGHIKILVRSRFLAGKELIGGTVDVQGRSSSVVPVEDGELRLSHIYLILLYQFSVGQLPCAILMQLVRV